jgi:ATP-dependent DNA helicase RecG
MSVKTSVKILELMKANPEITRPELAKEVGKSIRSVERTIEKLKKENKIERIGADKGGYWQPPYPTP